MSVDYEDPPNSKCFQALKNSQNETVRYLTACLEQCCSYQVEAVPNLETLLNQQHAPAAPSVECPKCGYYNPPDLIYCGNRVCLAPLHSGNRFCTTCGAQTPVNARFCPVCGCKT